MREDGADREVLGLDIVTGFIFRIFDRRVDRTPRKRTPILALESDRWATGIPWLVQPQWITTATEITAAGSRRFGRDVTGWAPARE